MLQGFRRHGQRNRSTPPVAPSYTMENRASVPTRGDWQRVDQIEVRRVHSA